MKVTIKKGTARGRITAPPSKSVAHRMLICAALAEGKSVVRGVAMSEDVRATLDCVRSLGASCEIDGDTVRIRGCGGRVRGGTFPCRESGSTLRFFIPIACLSGEDSVFTGTERLVSRGIGVYEDVLGSRGVRFETKKTEIGVHGSIAAGEYEVYGGVSSQFISGLMFALSVLDGESAIRVKPPFESRSYVMITVDAMRKFGAHVEYISDDTFAIHGGGYRAADVTVEGDWSNAAFTLALDELGGDVELLGLDPESNQGDRVIAELFHRLRAGYAEIDLSDCPDTAPILFAMAAAFGNGAKFTGTRRLRIKESDRAAVMAEELAKFGVRVTVLDDEVTVAGGGISTPQEILCGHGDHRIVMSMSVLCSLTGGVIEGAEAITKSYPNFFDDLSSLGLEIEYEA